MINKKIAPIAAVIILLLIIVGLVYYFIPMQSNDPAQVFNPFTLTILRSDLEPWETDKFTTEFNALVADLQIDPDNFSAWMNLGQLKKNVGDYRGAEAIWLHVNEIRPGNSVSFNNLGDLYANFLNEYDKAETQFLIAIENSTGEDIGVAYYRSLHDLYLNQLQDEVKLEQLLVRAIEMIPDSAEFHVLLGQHFERIGDNAKALDSYTTALQYVENKKPIQQDIDRLKQAQ